MTNVSISNAPQAVDITLGAQSVTVPIAGAAAASVATTAAASAAADADRAETAEGSATAAAAAAAASAADVVVPLYTAQMKAAVGSGSLDVLFDMDGPRTAYSSSETVMTALASLEGNAYSAAIGATVYSGTDPRPEYTAGRGIYLSSGAGFTVNEQLLPGTSTDFAFLYAVDLNTLTSTVSLESSLPGSPTDGDLVLVNGDRNIDASLGNDAPFVLDCDEFDDADLVNGYFRWNANDSTWHREVYLFYTYGTGGVRFEARINHLGQLVVFGFDGSQQVKLISKGRVVVGDGLLVFAVRRHGDVWSMVVDGQTVFSVGKATSPNLSTINEWNINGRNRPAVAAQPVGEGLRHYWKGMAIATDLPDDAAFVRLHDTFATRHGGRPLAAARAGRGVVVMGQSWTQGAVTVTDSWTHGANSWDGEIAPNNATYAQEKDLLTRQAFPNVLTCRDNDSPWDIGPVEADVNNFGNTQSSTSHVGFGNVEMIKGWAAQVNAHAMGQLTDWYVAGTGQGGASIATLSYQSVVPLPTQLKTITLQTADYYNKVLRQIVYQRDFAMARGQTFSVDLLIWQQGHTDLANASYLTDLRTLYDRLCQDITQITGQSHKPVLLAPQINWSQDGTANTTAAIDQLFLDMEDQRSTSLPTGDGVPRPMFCIGPMYQITNFIHPYRAAHRWIGELFGQATVDVLFGGQSYLCLRPYAFTYSIGDTTIDIDYRVRSGRSIVVNATNENQIPSVLTNAGFVFTDASAGGVTISSVAATDSNTIRVTLSGAIGAGDTIAYLGATARTGNVADGAAVAGLYRDQDWSGSFTGSPTFDVDGGEFNDLRQWGVAFTEVLS